MADHFSEIIPLSLIDKDIAHTMYRSKAMKNIGLRMASWPWSEEGFNITALGIAFLGIFGVCLDSILMAMSSIAISIPFLAKGAIALWQKCKSNLTTSYRQEVEYLALEDGFLVEKEEVYGDF